MMKFNCYNKIYSFIKTFFSLVIFVHIFLFIFGVRESQAVSDASFLLLPPSNSSTFIQGCIYTSDIRVNTGSSISNASDIIIQYDPQKIEIVDSSADIPGIQILPGNAYDAYFGNIVDDANGIIRLTGASVSRYLQGESVFGHIRFKAKAGVTSASFAVRFDGAGATADSNIAIAQTSLDALGSVNSLNLNFASGNCLQDTSAPNISFINPQNGQSNVSTNAVIQIGLSDDLAGVDIAEVEVLINGVRYTSIHPDFSVTGPANNYSIVIHQDNKIFANSPSVIYVKAVDYAGNIKTSSIYINPPSVIITPSQPLPVPTTAPNTPTDLVPPVIEFLQPVSRQTIAVTDAIRFKIIDAGSGVSLNSLQIFVNETKYIASNTACKFTEIDGGYLVEILDKFIFPDDAASSLFVTVLDNSGNGTTEKVIFNIPASRVEEEKPVQTETKIVEVEKLIPAPLKDTYTNVEDGVDTIQKKIEDVSPNTIRPVVKETGFLGLASLALFIPYIVWLISVLVSFFIGGYFLPFVRLFFVKKKVYQPHSDIVDFETKMPISWVRIKIINKASRKEFYKYVSNRAGRFYAHLPAGDYTIELFKRLYLPKSFERSFNESTDIEEIFELTPLQVEDIAYKIQFGVLNFDAKKFITSVASVLALINLIFTQSLTALGLLLVLMSATLYTVLHETKRKE